MAPHHALVVLFDVIVLLAILLLIFTLAPAIFSRKIQRSIGWYSLMTAWLVYSLSYGLLIGRQETPAPPPFGICLAQTLLIYAVPPLVAAGMVCYYIEFYLIISGLKSGNPRPPSTLRTFWLVVIPWLVFLGVVLEVLVVCMAFFGFRSRMNENQLVFPGKRAHLVERTGNNYYCHLNDNIPNNVSAAVVIAAMLILIPLEVWTGSMMYRNWDVFKRLSRTDRHIFLTVYLRLILCSLAAVIAFALSMLAFAFPEPDATSLVYPTLPIFIGFAFATQKDLLRAWLFWRPAPPYNSIVFNNGTVFTTNLHTSYGATTTEMSTETQTGPQMHKSVPTADSLGSGTILPDTPSSTSTVLKMGPGTSSKTPSPAVIHLELAHNRSDSVALGRIAEVESDRISESKRTSSKAG